jgi:hypothetical protein
MAEINFTKAQGIVEFALILPILLVLLIGSVDIGRYLILKAELQNNATTAAQYAALCPDTATVIQLARRSPGSLATCEFSRVNGETWPCNLELPQTGDQVLIYVWAPFAISAPFIGAVLGQLTLARAESIRTVTWPAISAVGCEVVP